MKIATFIKCAGKIPAFHISLSIIRCPGYMVTS